MGRRSKSLTKSHTCYRVSSNTLSRLEMNDDLRQLIELWNEKFAQVQDQLGTMDYCFATVDNSFANFAIELTVINSKLDKLLDHVLDQICKGQVGADETLVRLAYSLQITSN